MPPLSSKPAHEKIAEMSSRLSVVESRLDVVSEAIKKIVEGTLDDRKKRAQILEEARSEAIKQKEMMMRIVEAMERLEDVSSSEGSSGEPFDKIEIDIIADLVLRELKRRIKK